MEAQSSCFYHEQSEGFKSALKEIRAVLKIPSNLTKVCAMAICTCRKNTSHRGPLPVIDKDNQHGTECGETNLLDLFKGDIGPTTQQFVSDAEAARHKNVESAHRFYLIIRMAMDQKYNLLEEELKSRSRTCTSIHKEKTSVNVNINIPGAIRRIISKRKREAGHKVSWNIALENNHTINRYDDDISTPLHEIGKRYRPCVIEPNKKELRSMSRYVSKVPIQIWCSKKTLGSVVLEIQRKLMIVARPKPVRVRRRIFWHDYEPEWRKQLFDLVDAVHIKDGKMNDYNKKSFKSHHVASTSGDMDNMKCYNCQRISQKLPKYTQELMPTVTKTCKYHPGFIRQDVWSCCQLASDKNLPIHEQHASHGCTKEDCHKWLYQDKSYKSNVGNVYKSFKPNTPKRTKLAAVQFYD